MPTHSINLHPSGTVDSVLTLSWQYLGSLPFLQRWHLPCANVLGLEDVQVRAGQFNWPSFQSRQKQVLVYSANIQLIHCLLNPNSAHKAGQIVPTAKNACNCTEQQYKAHALSLILVRVSGEDILFKQNGAVSHLGNKSPSSSTARAKVKPQTSKKW